MLSIRIGRTDTHTQFIRRITESARITSPSIRGSRLCAARGRSRHSRSRPLRGLKWEDIDFEGLQLNLKRGLFRKEETTMKTGASRK
jgi:hypothetical protein